MAEQRVYTVTVHTTEEYAATVVAESSYEAIRKARQREWVDIEATGHILRNTAVAAHWQRDTQPEDLYY